MHPQNTEIQEEVGGGICEGPIEDTLGVQRLDQRTMAEVV